MKIKEEYKDKIDKDIFKLMFGESNFTINYCKKQQWLAMFVNG